MQYSERPLQVVTARFDIEGVVEEITEGSDARGTSIPGSDTASTG